MTPGYLRRLITTGQLPAGIANKPAGMGHWRIDVEALDKWMRNGCFTVPPGDDGAITNGGKVADGSPS